MVDVDGSGGDHHVDQIADCVDGVEEHVQDRHPGTCKYVHDWFLL